MKNFKKLWAAILAAVMILSIQTTAFAAVNDTGFSDVAAGAWYADSVEYVRTSDIMSGTSSTTFSPEGTMSRAMLATVLYRAAGSPAVTGTDSFTDTAANAYYSNAVLWAAGQGLIGGYGNELFGTNDPVSREQIAAILWRYAGEPVAESVATFADEGSISGYAAEAVHWARSNGVINGKSGNLFDPKGTATRAQVATILRNYLTMTPAETPDTPSATGKTLVVYFSLPETTDPNNMTTEEANSTVVIDGEVLGNTQYMATVVQETTGADIFRIEPQTPYTTNHTDLVAQASAEQSQNARPAIKTSIADFDSYDTVFIGYPIWWSDMPMILYTFFDTYDFSGKTIIPFGTHGGSSFAGTPSTIAQLEPNATMLDGLTISRNNIQDARAEIVSWVNGLGIQ